MSEYAVTLLSLISREPAVMDILDTVDIDGEVFLGDEVRRVVRERQD